MPRRKDIWRCGILARPLEHVLATGAMDGPVTWLAEEPSFQFLADPFGLRDEEGRLHLFVEQYDYRSRHGTIERLLFDEHMQLVDRNPCLSEPWHLSYPQVFAADGAVWMLPEAHRSGALTLYRDHGGLLDWRPECRIELDCVPVDATILRRDGRWYLFYSPATTRTTKLAHLHVAWADRLCGHGFPTRPIPCGSTSVPPVRAGPLSRSATGSCCRCRIAPPPMAGALRPLWINRLDERQFEAEAGDALIPPADVGDYSQGMHSLTACGDITLFDVKRIDASLQGLALDVQRQLGRFRSGSRRP